MSASKPWLVGAVKESDCKVTDGGSHVQRVLTESDDKVEKVLVALVEEKGETTYVDEGRDVERDSQAPVPQRDLLMKHP